MSGHGSLGSADATPREIRWRGDARTVDGTVIRIEQQTGILAGQKPAGQLRVRRAYVVGASAAEPKARRPLRPDGRPNQYVIDAHVAEKRDLNVDRRLDAGVRHVTSAGAVYQIGHLVLVRADGVALDFGTQARVAKIQEHLSSILWTADGVFNFTAEWYTYSNTLHLQVTTSAASSLLASEKPNLLLLLLLLIAFGLQILARILVPQLH